MSKEEKLRSHCHWQLKFLFKHKKKLTKVATCATRPTPSWSPTQTTPSPFTWASFLGQQFNGEQFNVEQCNSEQFNGNNLMVNNFGDSCLQKSPNTQDLSFSPAGSSPDAWSTWTCARMERQSFTSYLLTSFDTIFPKTPWFSFFRLFSSEQLSIQQMLTACSIYISNWKLLKAQIWGGSRPSTLLSLSISCAAASISFLLLRSSELQHFLVNSFNPSIETLLVWCKKIIRIYCNILIGRLCCSHCPLCWASVLSLSPPADYLLCQLCSAINYLSSAYLKKDLFSV